jgi:hypothetical protein
MGLQSLNGQTTRFHDVWTVAGEGTGYTWTGENPNVPPGFGYGVRIDYIFLGSPRSHPDTYCNNEAVALAFDKPQDRSVWPSDHFGVVVDLEIGRLNLST